MHTECQPGLVLFNQTVDFAVFLVWMPPTDPQQHTGESLVFVHCVVLKIELLFLNVDTENTRKTANYRDTADTGNTRDTADTG